MRLSRHAEIAAKKVWCAFPARRNHRADVCAVISRCVNEKSDVRAAICAHWNAKISSIAVCFALIVVRCDVKDRTIAITADQVTRYLDGLGLSEGWLVMFDLRKEISWQDKLFVKEIDHAGKRVRMCEWWVAKAGGIRCWPTWPIILKVSFWLYASSMLPSASWVCPT